MLKWSDYGNMPNMICFRWNLLVWFDLLVGTLSVLVTWTCIIYILANLTSIYRSNVPKRIVVIELVINTNIVVIVGIVVVVVVSVVTSLLMYTCTIILSWICALTTVLATIGLVLVIFAYIILFIHSLFIWYTAC